VRAPEFEPPGAKGAKREDARELHKEKSLLLGVLGALAVDLWHGNE
jgi:hypothetical protein